MNDTALGHRLVRNYLVRLDAAMRGAPAAQYHELRDQIVAHLIDTLPADADDAQVSDALSRLGTPADVAAEAKAGLRPTIRGVAAAGARRNWAKVRGARRRTKFLAAAIILVIGTGATYLSVLLSAPMIEFGSDSVPWYPQDADHQVFVSADGAQQDTFPIRSGHRQGMLFGIYNPSNFTQTVVGAPTIYGTNEVFGAGGFDQVQIGVSVPDREIAHGGMIRNVAFRLPESIPPHQYRLLRITWLSTMCLDKGSSFAINDLYVRVRVGWFTRTDVIPLGFGWGMAGPSSNPDPKPGPDQNTCR